MIVINDNDLPITVAEKIITGVRPFTGCEFQKKIAQAIIGEEVTTSDMFTLEEIAEIAGYLDNYIKAHQQGD